MKIQLDDAFQALSTMPGTQHTVNKSCSSYYSERGIIYPFEPSSHLGSPEDKALLRGGGCRLGLQLLSGGGDSNAWPAWGSLDVWQRATAAGCRSEEGQRDQAGRGRGCLGPEELTAPRPWPSRAATLQSSRSNAAGNDLSRGARAAS